MDLVVSYLINGLTYGLVLFLLATGMTMTMGLLRVVNMSHGAIFMICGFFSAQVWQWTFNWCAANMGSNLWAWILSLLAGIVMGGVLGLIIERCFLRRFYTTPMNQVLLTIGLIYVLTDVTSMLFGTAPQSAPIPSVFNFSIKIGASGVNFYKIVIIIIGILVAFGLWWMQDKTKIGAKVRAGMDNGVISGTLGINRNALFMFIFILGSAIAGLSGVVGGSVLTLNLLTGWKVLLLSIIVVMVGGSGSIQGALISAVGLGILNSFAAAYFSRFADFLFYAVLIIVLVIRPQGILGRKLDIDKASDDYANMKVIERRVFTPRMLADATGSLKAKLNAYKVAPYALVLIVAIILPFVTNNSITSMLSDALIYILFAISLDIVMGYTGNRSFGHGAYLGMGAYIVGLLVYHLEFTNFWVAFLLVIVINAALAAVIGLLTVKLSGTNFLLVTLAFTQLLSSLATQLNGITNGTDGINMGYRFNFGLGTEWWSSNRNTINTKVYIFILIIVAISFFLIHRFMHSSFGTTLLGIKGNEGRMRALGFNTVKIKYVAMIIAGIFAGVAGMLYAMKLRAVTTDVFSVQQSALPMLMVIIGGAATLWGPAIGAAVIIIVRFIAQNIAPDYWQLILGCVFVVCVMFLSNGVSPYLQKFYDWFGSKVFKKDLAKINAKEGK